MKKFCLLLILSFTWATADAGGGSCLNKKNFLALKNYILTKGYVQSSQVPPWPTVHHYSDDLHKMEFEHFSIYKPNKDPDHEKILIKKSEDIKYAYYIIMRGKKVTLEYDTDNKLLHDQYDAHFCELMHKMGFHD